jgi:hypothetical protein
LNTQDSNVVDVNLVNATPNAPAFMREAGDCIPNANEGEEYGCACDGTKLYPHVPSLVFDLKDLDNKNDDMEIEILPTVDGRLSGSISLTGKWVFVESEKNGQSTSKGAAKLIFPQKRGPKDQYPKWLKADSKALGMSALEGWVSSLQGRPAGFTVELKDEELRKPASNLVVAARVQIDDGTLEAERPLKIDGNYLVWPIKGAEDPHDATISKALSDRAFVSLGNRESVTLKICEQKECDSPQLLRFRGIKGDVQVGISNLPRHYEPDCYAESADQSDCSYELKHHVWFQELLVWKKNEEDACPNPLPRPGSDEEFEHGRRTGSNALCPISQWP